MASSLYRLLAVRVGGGPLRGVGAVGDPQTRRRTVTTFPRMRPSGPMMKVSGTP